MKKILLSCVTCLLALGLVTACDSEEEDVSGSDGDTTSQDTGGDTTTEAVTLTNYTVSFSFVDENNDPISLDEGVSLYLCGDWDNWASFLLCTEEDGVYSYTFASITVGTHEYKGVTYGGEDAVTWNNCTEVILAEDGSGNAKLVVSESDGNKYPEVIVTIIDTSLVASPYDDYYSLVGDFVDADWNGWPARTSKYYLGYDPEDITTMYWEVTVTIAEAPDFGEYSPWDAGLRVAEVTYNEETGEDDWTTIVGYSNLAENSTGVESWSDESDNIKLTTWGATYNLVIDCTVEGSESILVTLVTDGSEAE